MRPPTFSEFVFAVHNREPFPWQNRMAQRLLRGSPPQLITVPTGLGKTSVLDAWVWALAVQADRGHDRTVTTRAAFVVDRRVIVDAAFDHATAIQQALANPGSDPAKWVAERLNGLGHQLTSPLDVVRMRGGVTWAWRWLRQPDQPAVVVGTVDQFGSRYLFRGYGVGSRLRPIDAALVGTDITTFVDEAHLSTALGHTVRICTDLEAGAPDSPVRRPASIIAMSATPPIGFPPLSRQGTQDESSTLTIDADDLDHPVAAQRLAAVKLAELVDLVPSTKGAAVDSLAAELATRARAWAAQGQVVAVVVNTIDAARRTYELTRSASKKEPTVDAVLAIGRCRNLDREAARRRWWARAKANRLRVPGEPGLVVVATQTIEVGADLDVDTLITEIAPIDALVQRFGRVDRLGELGHTSSWIVRQPTRSAAAANRVYGEAADRTWEWLQAQSGFAAIDFGPASMGKRLRDLSMPELQDLMAPVAPIPEIFNEVLHQLARTNPAPIPDHPIATYLHGMQSAQPTVSVIWRAGMAAGNPARVLGDTPPTTAEAVEVPLVHFARFLKGEKSSFATSTSDLDIVVAADEIAAPTRADPNAALAVDAWRVREERERATDVEQITEVRALRPGDLVVLDATAGGHDEFGWTGTTESGPVADIADLVHAGPPQLRLHPQVLTSLLGRLWSADQDGPTTNADSDEAGAGAEHVVVAQLRALEQEALAALVNSGVGARIQPESIHQLLNSISNAAQGRPLEHEVGGLINLLVASSEWKVVSTWSPTSTSRSVGQLVVEGFEIDDNGAPKFTGLHLVAPAERLAIERADDSDLGSSLLGQEVSLSQHLGNVGDRAAAFAEGIGLPDQLIRTVRLAGHAHDLGKADPRFQALLRGGDWLAAAAFESDPTRALAKSVPGAPRSRGLADPAWRWPRGMRHEAVSVALFRNAEVPPGLDSELVEHLIASHHGWSRPLFPPVIDNAPRKVIAVLADKVLRADSDDVVVDWSQPERFRRLCERYGWWGLALLEAVLRLADMAVSEEGS